MITGKSVKSEYQASAGSELTDIMMECGVIKLYYDHLINFVDEQNKKFIQQLTEQLQHWIKTTPPDEHWSIYDSERFNLDRHRKFYPEIHPKSMYITIWSYLEERLRDICKVMYEDTDDTIVEFFQKDILNKYYRIIKTFCPAGLSQVLYKEIIAIRKIRNDLVHNKRKVTVTQNDVLQINQTVELFLYDIGKNISVPDTRPVFPTKTKKKGKRPA